jgi:hypothetical protein
MAAFSGATALTYITLHFHVSTNNTASRLGWGETQLVYDIMTVWGGKAQGGVVATKQTGGKGSVHRLSVPSMVKKNLILTLEMNLA